jgi:hypothetical protein
LEEAAFRPLSIRHWNFLGVPGTFLHQRILHRGFTQDEDESRHWWDRGIDFWFRAVENRFGFPVGVSLIAVATPYFEKASVKSPLPGKGFCAARCPRGLRADGGGTVVPHSRVTFASRSARYLHDNTIGVRLPALALGVSLRRFAPRPDPVSRAS